MSNIEYRMLQPLAFCCWPLATNESKSNRHSEGETEGKDWRINIECRMSNYDVQVI